MSTFNWQEYLQKQNVYTDKPVRLLENQELKDAITWHEKELRSNDPNEAPENYYCDGEITPEEAHARYQRWENRLDELTQERESRK